VRRVYRQVSVAAVPDGFAVLLDDRRLQTPARRDLVLPQALAEAVAEEWRAQGATVKPSGMPFMRIASTAIDRVAARRAEVVAGTTAYAASDLLCYRAEEPPELAARQAAEWQPLLDWAMLRFDAPLLVGTGIMIAQPADSLGALARAVAGFDLLALTALADLTGLAGSLVVALAVWERRLDGRQAADIVLLDETFQAERWGEDEDAAAHRAALRAEIAAVARFFDLLPDERGGP
jgi:chaperone required for assembly of F1-ATPase